MGIKKALLQTTVISAIALFAASFSNCAKTETPSPAGTGVLDEIKNLLAEHFFNKSMLPAINSGLDSIKNNPGANRSIELKRLFGGLGVSHLGFFTKDDLDYYELLEIYRFAHEKKLKKMFPPNGVITYPGIGVAPRLIDGRYFVAFIYAGTPTAQADMAVGDELLTVDGEPYSPIAAFDGKIGKTVRVALRRERDGPVLERRVAVTPLNPQETLSASTAASAKVIERDGRKIGYIRLYFCSSSVFEDILIGTISGGAFAAADALVLDTRGRWGGAPLDAAELFVGGAAAVESVSAANERRAILFRWNRPVVAVIGSETRSGLETMAYSLKKGGVPMVGATTAGAVLAGTTFLLSDGSLLLVPVADVLVDDKRIEGVGVAPTVPVEAALEYCQGVDLPLDAATKVVVRNVPINITELTGMFSGNSSLGPDGIIHLDGHRGSKVSSIGPNILSGGRSRESILRIFSWNKPSLRYAYNKRLRDKPHISGKITVKLAINEFGSVISAQAAASTLYDTTLEQRVTDLIKGWDFQMVDIPKDVTEMEFPIVFEL